MGQFFPGQLVRIYLHGVFSRTNNRVHVNMYTENRVHVKMTSIFVSTLGGTIPAYVAYFSKHPLKNKHFKGSDLSRALFFVDPPFYVSPCVIRLN